METTEPKPSKPQITSNVLKFGVLAGVAVLLIAGIWWSISTRQKEKLRIEAIIGEIENKIVQKEPFTNSELKLDLSSILAKQGIFLS